VTLYIYSVDKDYFFKIIIKYHNVLKNIT